MLKPLNEAAKQAIKIRYEKAGAGESTDEELANLSVEELAKRQTKELEELPFIH